MGYPIDDVPDGSIYRWMYIQGLKHVEQRDIADAVFRAGKQIRDKDWENYWNGFYRSDLHHRIGTSVFELKSRGSDEFSEKTTDPMLPLSQYPMHPYLDLPEVEERWIPCDAANRPMYRWKEKADTLADAKAYTRQVYLAENLKGTKRIVIDCDGDHDDVLDLELIRFLWKYTDQTHTLMKPKLIREYEGYEDSGLEIPASFHLTFTTDRVIPTKHFWWCNMDIVGNEKNSLRYWKNKKWNNLQPIQMTDEIWDDIRNYVERKRIEYGKDSVGMAERI